MRWEVRGADRSTGQDVVRTYEAASEEAAAERARADGVLVESADVLIDFGPGVPSGQHAHPMPAEAVLAPGAGTVRPASLAWVPTLRCVHNSAQCD